MRDSNEEEEAERLIARAETELRGIRQVRRGDGRGARSILCGEERRPRLLIAGRRSDEIERLPVGKSFASRRIPG